MEEIIYSELIRGAFKTLSDNLPKYIQKVNEKRLDEKKVKKSKEDREQAALQNLELNTKELLNGSVTLNIDSACSNIQRHIDEAKHWSGSISFSDLNSERRLSSIYIHLDTFLMPASRQMDVKEKCHLIKLETAILEGKEHCILLGQPGAGKTTSLKKICQLVIEEPEKIPYTFPILIRLREINEITSDSPIIETISKIFPFEFSFTETRESRFSIGPEEARKDSIIAFLDALKPIIILDGFDELKDSESKRIVLAEIRHLNKSLRNAKVVTSCRTGEFNYSLEHTKMFEIAPLSSNQIEQFVYAWLNDEQKVTDFISKVELSPFADASIKPLTLAHLCAIYERVGSIPEQPKTVYRKVVNLLVEEWDEQRSIVRKSGFDSFQSDRKFEFLTHLAFRLTIDTRSTVFTIDQIRSTYGQICEDHGLPQDSLNAVMAELEAHTGLFVETGYKRFEFIHKSIQEYLVAEYIVKLPSMTSLREHFEYLSSELAIAVSISSNSSLFFVELVLNYFMSLALTDTFYGSFTSRLISENPTFRKGEYVGIAALALISSWLNPGNKKFNQYKVDDYSVKNYMSFYELSNKLQLKDERHSIHKYYRHNLDYFFDDKVSELIRIKVSDKFKRLPKRVYLPFPFYAEFINAEK